MTIDRCDQVWSTDVTYPSLEGGQMFLAAVIDWNSRFVLPRRLSNTLDGRLCPEAPEAALGVGRPEVFNTDQGSQFTARTFTGRAPGNVFIERLSRPLRYKELLI